MQLQTVAVAAVRPPAWLCREGRNRSGEDTDLVVIDEHVNVYLTIARGRLLP